MKPREIQSRLETILRDELAWEGPIPAGRLDESFDSLELMNLVVAIEDTFEIVLDAEDELAIETTEDILEVVAVKLGGRE